MEQLQEELEEAKKTLKQQKVRISDLNKGLGDALKKVENRDAEVKKLTERCVSYNIFCDELKEEKTALMKENKELQAKLQNEVRDGKVLVEERKNLKEAVKRLTEDKKNLENQVNAMTLMASTITNLTYQNDVRLGAKRQRLSKHLTVD